MPSSEMPGSPAAPPQLPSWLARAIGPLPLAPLQPVLALMLTRIGKLHPGLYERLGEHAGKRFGIAPTDLPFAFVLETDPRRPAARAVRRLPGGMDAKIDARICGPLAGLIGMAEGSFDGDALFFSRALAIEGDIAAVLALRNALDDARLDLGTVLFGGFGPLGEQVARLLRRQFLPGTASSGERAWN